jgi:hypothetical protein
MAYCLCPGERLAARRRALVRASTRGQGAAGTLTVRAEPVEAHRCAVNAE